MGFEHEGNFPGNNNKIMIHTRLDVSSVFTDAGLSNVASAEVSCFLGGGTAPGNIVAGLNIIGF